MDSNNLYGRGVWQSFPNADIKFEKTVGLKKY